MIVGYLVLCHCCIDHFREEECVSTKVDSGEGDKKPTQIYRFGECIARKFCEIAGK